MLIHFTIDDILFTKLKEEVGKKDLLQKQGFYTPTVTDIVGALLIRKAEEESTVLDDQVEAIVDSASVQTSKKVN